jgi:uncharacterized protein YdhG (YjbR/CyaY superfamily)
MTVESNFNNKKKFSKLVEDTVLAMNISYMEAIIHICDENDVEYEDTRKFISQAVKDKLEAEAMNLNFLPKTNSLDSAFFE